LHRKQLLELAKELKRLIDIMTVLLNLFHQLALSFDARRTFADMPLG
jgi:hypothetical protein